MRPCFKFTAKAGNKPAVLALDEEIGFWGVQAKDFRSALDTVDGNELVVEINSPGGDVMAGLGMYNMLRNWAGSGKSVTTRVTGVAASIASVVALAGDKREMPKNSFAMVHQVSNVMLGAYTADELREAADLNDKISAQLRNIYTSRMGVDDAKAAEIMSKDTWLTAEECLEMGFATDLTDDVQATAKFDVAKAELPEHVAKVFKAKEAQKPAEDKPTETERKEEAVEVPYTPVARQIEALANEAGLQSFAAHLALACDSVDLARGRITAAREITALCALAGRPDDAKAHILANKAVPEVRTALMKAMAEADEHTNSARSAQTQSAGATGGSISAKEVYAKRAARKQNSTRKGT
ncbi:major capsid protein [Acidovorax phage ACF1]|nr:major capsid protein [Acidovorax phage ACF1]